PYDKIDTLLDLSFTPVYSRNTAEYSVVKAYHSYLYENRLIDFDLILNLTCNLLLKNDVLCERLSLIMRYILVDEYQDTSHIQYEILRLIVSKRNSLVTFIGDKEQAIYTGLGAVVKNREELFDYFNLEELEEMRLTGCFRSSQSIIDFYSKYKDDAYYINSLSELKTFPSVILKENSVDITQLSVYVSGIIRTHLEQGISPGEIAVLCPSWFDVIKLSNEIISLNSDLDIDGIMVSPIPKNNENLWLNLVKLALIEKNPSNYLVRQKLLRDL
ncbi:TPA: UvrD-helicase domain-containing protein, partial [Klebsiella pneumoniae]